METKDFLENWYDTHFSSFFADYCAFLEFASISTNKAFQKDLFQCANWLSAYIKKIGIASELIPTSKAPIVFGEYGTDPKLPTVLIYGHYDVQPTDPEGEWVSHPFKPCIREGQVYARGAVDDKGQVFYAILALQALLERDKKLPMNIKLCIEGGEESGSEGLATMLPSIKEKIKADYLIVVDSSIPDENTPAINLGCRGIVPIGLELQGSHSDLHSGQHGGLAYNPLRALVQILNTLWTSDGKIAVPGFYDDVKPLSEEEKKEIFWDFDQKKYQKDFGIGALWKEKGSSLIEANWILPTIEINGINGGYSQEGFKTVIPAKAIAKLSCRLVPNQNPETIFRLVRDYLIKQVPNGMKCTVETERGGLALRGSGSSLLAQSVSMVYSEVFGAPCRKVLGGGSIPVIAEIVHLLQCDVILMGMEINTDNIHAPNEHFGLDRLKKGFLVMAKAIQILANKKV